MHIDLGWMPLGFIIQSRRYNSLKYIFNQEESSLMKNVFNEQLKKPNQGDWVKTIDKDIRKLNINKTLNKLKTCQNLLSKS